MCFGVLRQLIDVWGMLYMYIGGTCIFTAYSLLPAAQESAMPGFVEYMYKKILPACFLAPLKPTFDLNDGNSFVVNK